MRTPLPISTALLFTIAVLCGCGGKSESEASSKETGKTAPTKNRKPKTASWDVDPATEAAITFYVQGMSKRLKLT